MRLGANDNGDYLEGPVAQPLFGLSSIITLTSNNSTEWKFEL